MEFFKILSTNDMFYEEEHKPTRSDIIKRIKIDLFIVLFGLCMTFVAIKINNSSKLATSKTEVNNTINDVRVIDSNMEFDSVIVDELSVINGLRG